MSYPRQLRFERCLITARGRKGVSRDCRFLSCMNTIRLYSTNNRETKKASQKTHLFGSIFTFLIIYNKSANRFVTRLYGTVCYRLHIALLNI